MILALETSTRRASLALLGDGEGEVAWESVFETDRAHNSAIFEPVAEVLDRHRSEIRGIAVGTGPGSYGGVRVAISVANGLGLALEVPLLGVSSLLAYGDGPCFVAGDARRKTFFLAEVTAPDVIPEPELLEEAPFREQLERIGSSKPVVSADDGVVSAFEGVEAGYPSAIRIGRIAAATPPGEWPVPARLEPVYLRAPYITTPKRDRP